MLRGQTDVETLRMVVNVRCPPEGRRHSRRCPKPQALPFESAQLNGARKRAALSKHRDRVEPDNVVLDLAHASACALH